MFTYDAQINHLNFTRSQIVIYYVKAPNEKKNIK